MHHLEDMLGAPEIAETVLTEIDEVVAVVTNQLDGRQRRDDLTPVGDRHETGSSVQDAPVVVAITQLGHTGVQAHPNPQRTRRAPVGP